MAKPLYLAVLLLAAPLAAQDAAAVALDKSANLAAALKSTDALTRTTAGRVAMVRGDAALVPALREALAAEKDATAAREEMRALVLLGSDEDVAFAASQLPRFPASIDGDFAEAVGRLGAPRATTLYLEHVVKSRDPVPAVNLALWGRPALASATAARLLGAGDARGWEALLSEAARAQLAIDPAVLANALKSKSNRIVNDTIWHLVEAHGEDPSKFPAALRETAAAERAGAAAGEMFGREVIRRMLGAEREERPEWLEWLRVDGAGIRNDRGLHPHLTPRETRALPGPEPMSPTVPPPNALPSLPVKKAPVSLPILLPDGLAEAILNGTGCRDPWIGQAKASVDGAGRVQALDVSNILVGRGCGQALETMLRLSLAEPETIASPRENVPVVVVKPFGSSMCFSEDPMRHAVWPRGPRTIGGKVKPAEVVKRVQPMIPASVRRDAGSGSVMLVAEVLITKTGCVREARLVKATEWPSLNSAALLALAEWTFKPATLDFVPVDVRTSVTMNFQAR